jgi:hypothetical protein
MGKDVAERKTGISESSLPWKTSTLQSLVTPHNGHDFRLLHRSLWQERAS